MESWRGRGRQAGRDALARLVTAWKAGSDPGDPGPDGLVGPGRSGPGRSGGGRSGGGRSGGGLNGAAVAVPAGQPEQARADVPDRRENTAEHNRVPGWLQTGAAWSWRLLLLAAALYLVARVIGVLYIVVVPCTAALLLTALLQPLTARLRRAGLPGLAATWGTLLIAALVLGGIVLLVTNRVSADYPTLVDETRHTTTQVESWLSGPPFHIKSSNVQNALNNIPGYLSKHKALVEGTVVTGGKIAAEFFGGLVLMLFVMFFLIKDGAPAPAAGRRPGDPAAPAGDHPVARGRRRAGRRRRRRGGGADRRRDHPGGTRAATARSSPRRPVRCDSARMSRYPHRACKQ
jgi:AI-2E family transporter